MISESDRLARQWRVVASALGIEAADPPRLTVPGGGPFRFAVLLPQFGGGHGMLVAAEYSAVAFAEASAAGYGVTCMHAEAFHLPVDPHAFVGCLRDWGWSGSGPPPAWY